MVASDQTDGTVHKGQHMSKQPRLLILASGTETGGGSGARELVLQARQGVLGANIVGIASQHERGGVSLVCEELCTRERFIHFPGPWTAEAYQRLVRETKADFVACSGWLKLVLGLDPATTTNIHPGPLPAFGGKGMYGRHVHEAVMAAYASKKIAHTAICMHFVTPVYDDGPVFFRLNILVLPSDTPESLATRVNMLEHRWQSRMTNLIVTGQISWSGVPGDSVIYPPGYSPVLWAT